MAIVLSHREESPRWRLLRRLLLNDSVRPFVALFYAALFAWGLFGGIWAYPVSLIINPMGILVYNVWIWTFVVATTIALGGLALRHGGSPASEIRGNLLRRDYLGLWMQVGGHFCMFIVLTTYVGGAIAGAEYRQPVISVFVAVPLAVSAGFLAAQCVYKIRRGRLQ